MELSQQKLIIVRMLQQAFYKSSLTVQGKIGDLIAILNKKETDSMKKVIEATNLLLAELEHMNEAKSTLDFLKGKGLYRMLYRHPKVLGEELESDDILAIVLRNGFIGVGLSVLFIAAFVTVMLIGAPFWIVAITSGLFVGASTYLAGLLYGVVNDIFATHANLPYFLLGHQPQQASLLRTNNKIAQGIAWGVAATFGPVIIASIVFAVAATITAFFVPIATFLLPVIMVALPLIAVGAEFYARRKTKEYSEYDQFGYVGSNLYQRDGLRFMSPTLPEQAAWHANSDRNMFGFTKVPLIGLVVLVAMITLSALGPFLPAVLIAAPLLAVIIPAVCSGVAALALAIAGLYTYVNRNQHVDDRYNLEFERSAVNYDLYLDEDKDYVNELLQMPLPTGHVGSQPERAPQNYPSPIASKTAPKHNAASPEIGLASTSPAPNM